MLRRHPIYLGQRMYLGHTCPGPPHVRVAPAKPAAATESVSHAETAVPVEEVVAKHTATKLHHELNIAYLFQSLATGAPLMMVDLVVTGTLFIASSALINLAMGHGFNAGTWLQLPALLMLQVGLISLHQLYPGAGVSPVDELRGIVRSTFLAFLSLSAMNVLFGQLPRLEFVVFATAAASVAMLLPLVRYSARELLSRTSWWGIRTLLIGSRGDCYRMQERSQRCRTSGFIVADSLSIPETTCRHRVDGNLLDATVDALQLACRTRAPVATLVTPGMQHVSNRLIFQFPSLVWIDHEAAAQVDAQSADLLGTFQKRMSMPLLRLTPRLLKRGLDLAICVPTLLLLAIPMATIALAIKWFSPGPVIYGSPRVGQHGKLFKMWKFRSMVANADAVLEERLAADPVARAEWERDAKLKSDPRIIPAIGHFMRRYSIDELPQLWNVLVGEMSVVGPRPVPPAEIVRYQNNFYEYTHMWPGMTGLWQVSGRNETTFSTRVYLVRHYASNWSLWLDAWILAKTPIVVIAKKGAY